LGSEGELSSKKKNRVRENQGVKKQRTGRVTYALSSSKGCFAKMFWKGWGDQVEKRQKVLGIFFQSTTTENVGGTRSFGMKDEPGQIEPPVELITTIKMYGY